MRVNITHLLFIVIAKANADNMMDMAKERNIRIERHYVTTEDGYILGLYRLPSENSQNNTNRINTMFIMHGLISASPMFILYPGISAGSYFQNLGYDVWIGNARGNTFSRNHTTLDPEKPQFWQFSWHEIGYFDLPAMIDYALQHTKQEQLVYIGHSQGVTSSFVLLSERPGYNKKIAILHAMTPPILLKHHHPATPEERNAQKLEEWINKTGNYELFPYESFAEGMRFFGDICPTELMGSICKTLFDLLPGPGSPECYTETIPAEFATHMPAGIGYRQLLHFIQISNSGEFRKYDFGSEENSRIYGSTKPPEYNLSNIKTKIHILYGDNDYLVMRQNIPALVKRIRSAIVTVSRFEQFNHMDFAYGRLVENIQQLIANVTDRFT